MIDYRVRPTMNVLSLQQNQVESEESFMGIGISEPTEYTFYTLIDAVSPKSFSYSDPFNQNLLVAGYQIGVSPDQISYSRTIYTFLEWLGDIGGLTDALIYIG